MKLLYWTKKIIFVFSFFKNENYSQGTVYLLYYRERPKINIFLVKSFSLKLVLFFFGNIMRCFRVIAILFREPATSKHLVLSLLQQR